MSIDDHAIRYRKITACARDLRATTHRGSAEALVVGRRSVDRWHGDVVEPQIHGQLTSMMRKMMNGVLHHHVARRFGDDIAAGLEAPRFHQDRKSTRLNSSHLGIS